MKHILIRGFFGHDNLGDDLLFLEALNKCPENAILTVWGNSKNLEQFKQYRDFSVIHSLKEAATQKFDLVVFSGGGQFPSRTYSLREFMHHAIFIFRKKSILNGVGVVPKKALIDKTLFSIFLKFQSYISVRDKVSFDYVKSLGLEHVNLCGDLYWGNSSNELSKQFFKVGSNKIAIICLAQPFSKAELKSEHFNKRFNSFVQQLVTTLIHLEHKGFKLYFMPFYKESDMFLINEISKVLSINKENILVEGENYQLTEIDSIFSQADFGLCMRFHSKVLSVKNSLPFVGISYDYKSESLLEECDITKVGLRYGIRNSQFFGKEIDLSFNDLNERISYVVENVDEIKDKMKRFSEKKQTEMILNYQKINNLIN